jgi:hypothetical protein
MNLSQGVMDVMQRLLGWVVVGCGLACGATAAAADPLFADVIKADNPAFWWRFDGDKADAAIIPTASTAELTGKATGDVKFGVAGPRPSEYPAFADDNRAVQFAGNGGVIKFGDPGDGSPLDFTQGDAITLEAWVSATKLSNGQQMYVLGKGRTKNAGYPAENQNYALRLTGDGGQACVSFLFRDADNRKGESNDYHRWNSTTGFAVGGGWHHIAVSYVFGEPDSIRGYIDGVAVPGKWDYGGATKEAPVVDNDELWIGSSLGGNPSSTFHGTIDEVAIHRAVLPAERMAARYRAVLPEPYVTAADLVPSDAVLVEVFQGFPDKFNWTFILPEPSEQFTWPAFALTDLPYQYNNHGVRTDRTSPLMVRLSSYVTWPAGEITLRLRSRGGSRLWIDDAVVVENAFPTRGGDGHNELYPVPDDVPEHLRGLRTGDYEALATFTATGKPQRVQLDAYAGGKKRRSELGELVMTWKPKDAGTETVLNFGERVEFTNGAWCAYRDQLLVDLDLRNRDRRQTAAKDWIGYWSKRHDQAVKDLADRPKPNVASIDDAINRKLTDAKAEPLPALDDWAFLRRATLDLIGMTPTPDLIIAYFADPVAERRTTLIDRLLAHPGWADHQMGYWQDVLAENPNVINPTLNNTGPFRFWLHESFADNKPFDRFATELILMEGSTLHGGTAGFAMSSQNDAPMAAKAHVLAQAFLGMEMKCARCHDAPYHDFTQKDLFSLAAMLDRKPISLPKSSTIPGDPAALQSLLVKVTLKPGESISPEWPFADELSGRLSTDILLHPDDRREQLAVLITAPENRRFAQVAVNRLWQRYFGRGIVEPVDDWEHAEPSHPELLELLEREFIASGFDLKHVTRLMLTSQLYGRQSDAVGATDARRAALFAGPAPRRMSAEQLVDSLFAVCGKPMRVEDMNIDVDGTRAENSSINLGAPKRAWQFTSMSNERDRPSLSLPAAQTVLDVLETFGWRSTRPDPISVRPTETTVLQPAILANGVVPRRVTQFSDDSRFTTYALEDVPVAEFINHVYRTVLCRPPRAEESALFTAMLADGYADRRVAVLPSQLPPPVSPATGVSWSNHLKPEANERKTALKQLLDAGDPPTPRLKTEWRERAEDFVWTLINSPEFVFVP